MATHAEGSEAGNGDYGGLIDVDFRKIWGAIVRNQIIIYSSIALSLLVGIAATLLMTPQYRAETVVQIEQQETKVLDSQDTDPVPTTQEADQIGRAHV